jgi:hypothetical protein
MHDTGEWFRCARECLPAKSRTASPRQCAGISMLIRSAALNFRRPVSAAADKARSAGGKAGGRRRRQRCEADICGASSGLPPGARPNVVRERNQFEIQKQRGRPPGRPRLTRRSTGSAPASVGSAHPRESRPTIRSPSAASGLLDRRKILHGGFDIAGPARSLCGGGHGHRSREHQSNRKGTCDCAHWVSPRMCS